LSQIPVGLLGFALAG